MLRQYCVVLFPGKEIPATMDVGVQSTGHAGNITDMVPNTIEKTEPGDAEILIQTHTVNQGHVGQGAWTWTPMLSMSSFMLK